MGDYPSRQAWPTVELTDQIFMLALQHEALRDEVYCQILKQLTHNSNRHSEERGWQLLWLCTGLFPPGKGLLPHTQKFIDTRRGKLLAPDCSRRIQRVLRTGPRKQPPHQLEVEAAEQNVSRICHKIFFPNDTSESLPWLLGEQRGQGTGGRPPGPSRDRGLGQGSKYKRAEQRRWAVLPHTLSNSGVVFLALGTVKSQQQEVPTVWLLGSQGVSKGQASRAPGQQRLGLNNVNLWPGFWK
ncbi:hypothetical protein P7K49_014355 [Saguinus oedipus]|uniref:MyTH4 domain-containing protein n=1 Tax=Saguinus oedipus TaxID=9490 RepID=A0ABQ9VIK4_SAGOE|nr:hypothetical protein P7K49_014355 [Saguinus oedipus]